MIKAIIFDVGGVLIRTHDHGPRRRLEERLGLKEWESEVLVFSGEHGTAAQMGAISEHELWRRIASALQLDDRQLDEFQEAFWAGDELDLELISLIQELRRAGYQTAIISNATDRLRQLLSEEHEIAGAFDLIVCSAEEKIMKPDTEIYQRTLQRLGVTPRQAVFIDDNEDNVRAAQALGIHAIHYREGLDVKAALARLDVKISKDDMEDFQQLKEYVTGEQPHD